MINKPVVTYEAFGAVGNGVADDLPSICAAHEYANAHGLPVQTKGDAIYHLGRRALTAKIATDTDWNTSRFTIDDRDVEDHACNLFLVPPTHELLDFQISRLSKDQTQLPASPDVDCYVYVENDQQLRFLRKGLNQSKGTPQHDSFVLRNDGSISSPIDWDYDTITRMEVRPLEEKTLRIQGGIFTTVANCMHQEVGYTYWARNILITRSNTVVDGMTHYVVGETDVGHPYGGFLETEKCVGITFQNCFFSGHKTYTTIGVLNEPVSMGSYDVLANDVVNFSLLNCSMHHILDRSHWGVIGTNFCKNILLEGCTLSRMDTHMGVSGGYTIRDCTLGHMGLNAIGRGKLVVENSTLYGFALINFRQDYGSIWDGEVLIKNCKWIPSCGEEAAPRMFCVVNDGLHDFGYACSMPERVRVDGLTVDDRNHPEGYEGMLYFTDPDGDGKDVLEEVRPFPYQKCKELRVRGVTCLSGKAPQVCRDSALLEAVSFVDEDAV
ncbi:hypothetical protein P3T73_00870 [Kiritimatiellota bacterium B12222]|nr:hypothetical protein P3T73_00870 [Kiritimatiellota bacterium B12222]